MKKNDSPEKILELLKNARNIALFTHSRPDGDAIGSTLALKSALERMGKKAFAFCDTEIGHKYDSLGFGKFFSDTPRGNFDLYVALDCGDSGSTLRFLLPLFMALGRTDAVFTGSDRLLSRPIPGDLGLRRTEQGLALTRPLTAGHWSLPGDETSQLISGMLLALPLLPGDSDITVTGEAVSRPYVQMTLAVLALHGVTVEKITDGWHIPGGQFCRPAPLLDEPDWSAAAYWLVLRALLPRQRREALRIPLAPPPYLQGDAAILRYLDKLPEQIDISDTPDLLPPLALYAALRPGRDTRFTHAAFLRQKESDRLTAVSAVLNALGASAEVQPDGLVIHGVSALHGGDVSACGDHRIALLAGCAAMVADGPVTLSGAETVAKSYPAFWRELAALGGNWEVLES